MHQHHDKGFNLLIFTVTLRGLYSKLEGPNKNFYFTIVYLLFLCEPIKVTINIFFKNVLAQEDKVSKRECNQG